MQKRNVSKSVKAILDKFQLTLDSEEMSLEDIQEWCQEINFLLNTFIEQVNLRFKELKEAADPEDDEDTEQSKKDFGGFYS